MGAPIKRNAGVAPGGFGEADQACKRNDHGTGRPAYQGKSGNARHAGQRPPQWRKPAGADGLAMLEALFGPPCLPFKRGQRR